MLVFNYRFSVDPVNLNSSQLFYKNGRVRVVVSTANLIAYDWRDMENVR